MEDVVFVTFRAACALYTADEEHSHAQRNEHGENDSVLHEPMRESLHFGFTNSADCRTLISMRRGVVAHSKVVRNGGYRLIEV
jgi:hypothetical protein